MIINGLTAILFMIGYVIFGIAMIRTVTLPRWSGVLVALGAPAHLLSFGIAQLVSTVAWAFAILRSVSLGAGVAWPCYWVWHGWSHRASLGLPLVGQQGLKAAYQVGRLMQTKLTTKCGRGEAGAVPLVAYHDVANVGVGCEG